MQNLLGKSKIWIALKRLFTRLGSFLKSKIHRLSRLDTVAAVMLVLSLCVGLQLIWLQGVQGSTIAKDAQDARTRVTKIMAQRGTIMDANGNVLAASVERYNVGVNQKIINNYVPAAPGDDKDKTNNKNSANNSAAQKSAESGQKTANQATSGANKNDVASAGDKDGKAVASQNDGANNAAHNDGDSAASAQNSAASNDKNPASSQDQTSLNQSSETSGLDSSKLYGAAAAAAKIAPILGVDRLDLGAKMVGDKTFAYIAKNISPEQWNKIAALKIPGIEPEKISKRVYPNGNVAGNIIGFVDRDGTKGLGGIEQVLNKELSGKDGHRAVEVDRNGVTIPSGYHYEKAPVPGQNVQLTIDQDLQDYAQKQLDKTVRDFSAAWGALVIVDVQTGRILALADSNSVNPNEVGKTPIAGRGSHAVKDPLEPGSTGKLLTYASAIDQKKITPTTLFYVTNPLTMPNGQVINDAEPHGPATMTVAGLLATSYNSGMVQVGDRLTDKVRYEYMQKFGLGKKTGILLPGEAAGILHPYQKWSARDHYTTMFGQALAVTTVQLAGIAQSIANEGVYISPHVVDGYVDKQKNLTPARVPEKRRVISAEASKTLLSIMEEGTARGGTSILARIPGYRVAAKTGTAQTAGPGGPLSGVNSTFIGITPADKPRLAMAIMVHLPALPGYATYVDAPLFKEVASFALHKLGIAPSATEHVPYPWYKEQMK